MRAGRVAVVRRAERLVPVGAGADQQALVRLSQPTEPRPLDASVSTPLTAQGEGRRGSQPQPSAACSRNVVRCMVAIALQETCSGLDQSRSCVLFITVQKDKTAIYPDKTIFFLDLPEDTIMSPGRSVRAEGCGLSESCKAKG